MLSKVLFFLFAVLVRFKINRTFFTHFFNLLINFYLLVNFRRFFTTFFRRLAQNLRPAYMRMCVCAYVPTYIYVFGFPPSLINTRKRSGKNNKTAPSSSKFFYENSINQHNIYHRWTPLFYHFSSFCQYFLDFFLKIFI